MTRSRALVVAALAVSALLAGCAGADGGAAVPQGAAAVRANGQAGWHGTPLTRGYPLPDQRFTDTSGATVVPATDVAAPVTVVFFGYTHCPDICNVVLANIASALRGSSAPVRESVEVLFVATDPVRDTPAAVRAYLDRFSPAYVGLTAPAGVVAAAARDLHISYERPDGTAGGSYEVEHGTYVTGFAAGRARVVWSESTSVAGLRADLERLVSGAA